jgi:hypothetical protein
VSGPLWNRTFPINHDFPHQSPFDEIACCELVELVTPYLEGVLPPDERALVD